jgi:hypothetical protein
MAKRKLVSQKKQCINRLPTLNRPLAEQLRHLITDLLRGGVTKAAGDFTLAEVVEVFGLNYAVIWSRTSGGLRIRNLIL